MDLHKTVSEIVKIIDNEQTISQYSRDDAKKILTFMDTNDTASHYKLIFMELAEVRMNRIYIEKCVVNFLQSSTSWSVFNKHPIILSDVFDKIYSDSLTTERLNNINEQIYDRILSIFLEYEIEYNVISDDFINFIDNFDELFRYKLIMDLFSYSSRDTKRKISELFLKYYDRDPFEIKRNSSYVYRLIDKNFLIENENYKFNESPELVFRYMVNKYMSENLRETNFYESRSVYVIQTITKYFNLLSLTSQVEFRNKIEPFLSDYDIVFKLLHQCCDEFSDYIFYKTNVQNHFEKKYIKGVSLTESVGQRLLQNPKNKDLIIIASLRYLDQIYDIMPECMTCEIIAAIRRFVNGEI